MDIKNLAKKILITALAGIVCLPVAAEELDFKEFVSAAFENSYNMKLAKIERSIASKGIKEAQSGYYPTLNAFATTERYNDLTHGQAQITAVGNEILLNRNYYQDMASVGLTYNVFDFGIRRKGLEIAKADEKQKELLLMKTSRDLRLDTVDIYGEILNLYKIVKIKTETLDLQNELIAINKRLRGAGELSEIDLVEGEIAAVETKSELDKTKNHLAKILTEVSYYTNRSYNPEDLTVSDFPSSTEDVLSDGVLYLSADILDFVPENSFEAQAADLEILKKKKDYEIQKKSNFPKVRFDTRYNFYGSDTSNFFYGIEDISQRSLTIRLSASMVLFDGFKNSSAVSKKKFEIEKAKVEKECQLAELKKKYEQIILDAKNSKIQYENNILALELVNKNLENLRRLKQSGLVSQAECIQKQIALLRKKQELEESQIKIYTACYKLKVLQATKGEL